MSKFTDIGVEKHGHVGLIEIRRPPLNFFDVSLINQIADALEEFDRDIEIRALGAGGPGQGVLRRRQFQRSGAAGAGSARQDRSGVEPADQPSLRPGGAHLPQQEADRRRHPWRGDRRRPRACGIGGFPRHLPRSALRRQLYQARLPSRLRTDHDASRTGRQEQCGTDFLHQPPRHRRGSHSHGPCQCLRAAGPGPQRGDEARRRRSPNARRSACSRPAPPCAPASPTACWPPPITNWSNKTGCAPPKISRKASKPPPNAASRISGGGEFTYVVPCVRMGARLSLDQAGRLHHRRDDNLNGLETPACAFRRRPWRLPCDRRSRRRASDGSPRRRNRLPATDARHC